MVVDIRFNAYLFKAALLLVFLCLAFFLFLVVFEFSEINYPAYRRRCRWGNLNQVQFILICQIKRPLDSHNPQLVTVRADEPNFWNADPFVYTDKFFNFYHLLLILLIKYSPEKFLGFIFYFFFYLCYKILRAHQTDVAFALFSYGNLPAVCLLAANH